MVRLNNSDQMELIEVYLTKSEHPIAYEAKKKELMENGLSEMEADMFLHKTPFILEIYYDKDNGLFAVESEAVESGTVYSPYTGELCEKSEEI